MGKIYAIIHKKGGVGKSITTVNLAHCMALQGINVHVVDTDEQESVCDFNDARLDSVNEGAANPLPFTIEKLAKDEIMEKLDLIAEKYDVVLVDTPGVMAEETKMVLVTADFGIIPCLPAKTDVKSLYRAELSIQEAQHHRVKRGQNPLVCVAFFNKGKTNAKVPKDAAEWVKGCNIPTLAARVHNRQQFSDSFGDGYTVFDLYPHGDGAKEITSLWAELKEFIANATI